MNIIVKGEVDRVDSQREVHHLTARKELEEEYKRRELILSGAVVQNSPELGGGSYRPLDRVQDVPTMRKELKEYKKNYERGMPIKLSPMAKNAMWKKAKQLKDSFIVGMVSKKDMHPVKARSTVTKDGLVTKWVADYDKLRETKAIERNRAWLDRNQAKLTEFKNIMRQLEPDNPNIANYERFRPER